MVPVVIRSADNLRMVAFRADDQLVAQRKLRCKMEEAGSYLQKLLAEALRAGDATKAVFGSLPPPPLPTPLPNPRPMISCSMICTLLDGSTGRTINQACRRSHGHETCLRSALGCAILLAVRASFVVKGSMSRQRREGWGEGATLHGSVKRVPRFSCTNNSSADDDWVDAL